jgi:uncharacterized protein
MPCDNDFRGTASDFEYDLSAVLVKAGTLYEKRLANDWLLYAPDWRGWPILVNDRIHHLLDSFRMPCSVGHALTTFVGTDAFDRRDLSALVNVVGFLEEKGFLRANATELPYPAPAREYSSPKTVEVWLHLTNACNLDCGYCFVKNKNATIMSKSVCDATAANLARTAVDNQIEKVTVKFAGGEPTLAMPIVERFRARFEAAVAGTGIRAHAALLSNGTQLNNRIIAFLERPNSSISISLDGYGDVHDIHRRTKKGAPSWVQIERNVELLQQRGISPFIMATISDETHQGLPDLVRWVFSRGLRTRIGVVREPSDKSSDGYTAYGRRVASSFEEAFALLQAEGIEFDPRSDLQICELRFDQPALGLACGIGSNHLVVRPDGTIASCPMTVSDGPGQPAGEDLLAACRSTFNPHSCASSDRAECLSCQWFPVCAGGCPVNNEKTRGTPFARSPLCAFYRMVIPRYLDLFGHKLQARGSNVRPN